MITKVLIHELPERTRELMERLRTVLAATGGGDAAALLLRATIEQREKPRMVLTGQYSSGKSSLIKALTDGAVSPVIDADISTDEVTEYPWDGAVVLVDTPGVQSGLRSHDELALDAIGGADFVLFVVPVNLFDDASRDYLRHLANKLQMFGQMVVVITQAGKQSAGEGVRERAVRDALGTVDFYPPIAEVDSVYYLRSLEGGERAETLRARSGIDGLRETINRISADRGELAVLRQPLHLIHQLCDEAQPLFAGDPRSQAALAALAQQRAAVSQRRQMIGTEFSAAESAFKSRCLVDVRGFVDTATSLPSDEAGARATLHAAERRLAEALDRHAATFGAAINSLANSQFDTLAEQLSEIADSNRAQLAIGLQGDVALVGPGETRQDDMANAHRPADVKTPVDWQKVAQVLKRGQEWWGAGGGLKQSSGSVGHQVVTDVGHFFNKKFAPWEAIKVADKIGKAVKWGSAFLQVATAGYEVWRNEQEARRAQVESERQHSAFVTEIMGHADTIAAEARHQLWAIVNPPLDEFVAEIVGAQEDILRADRSRSVASDELQAIAAEADRLLHAANL